MPAKPEPGLCQPRLPAVSGSDGGGVVEEAVFFLLLGQAGKLGIEGMVGRKECLLAMEDRRVWAGIVLKAIDLAGVEQQDDRVLSGP
jgi:hypothetical protein